MYVNGLCNGLLKVMIEFCEIYNLLLKNVKLIVDDVWYCCVYVFLFKI